MIGYYEIHWKMEGKEYKKEFNRLDKANTFYLEKMFEGASEAELKERMYKDINLANLTIEEAVKKLKEGEVLFSVSAEKMTELKDKLLQENIEYSITSSFGDVQNYYKIAISD